MRVRITRTLSGSIDGMHLDRFAVGEVYDVGTSIGSYLLAIGAAEPLADGPAKLIHHPEQDSHPAAPLPNPAETRRRPAFPSAVAADAPPRKKKR